MPPQEQAQDSFSKTARAGASSAAMPLPFWLRLVSRLPWSMLYGCGACLAFLTHRVLRYRRGVVRGNIARCFPQLERGARRGVERDYYHRLGQLFAEVLKSATITREELERRVVLHGVDAVRAELDADRTVLIVAAHQCNWEWLLLALSIQLGYPLDAAYKPLHGARSERLMRAMRTRFGSTLVPAKEVLGRILTRRSARALAMVADQEPVTSDYKWWTQFLGTSTAFYMGPEKIVQATRGAAFFAAMRRIERGRYVVALERLASASTAVQTGEITERYARQVETQVLASPADWMWSHRRWKLRRPVYGAANALDQGPGERRA
jgi:Kdo2-lipid IVA lauroyltransferase/acyltransferase